ncbi:MAG: molybdopterin-dependent oxidoreductase [Deltaproteobacteria bacterium]|nr:molybdopterin-dependent oxidoreductase [Deltaproteobacteria bacterium]
MAITRRQFLQGAGAGLVALSMSRLGVAVPRSAAAAEPALPAIPAYRTWEDLYRKQWSWDAVGRSTHFVNCWYQAHCCWDVYVKDGIVWREEQAADYPATKPGVLPDMNPRGCQKGACYSERMYDPTRLKFPLKRVGERGSGQWQRITWDQALDEIATVMMDTIQKEGTDKVVWSPGPLFTMGNMAAGVSRLALGLDSIMLDMNTEIGDGHHGSAVTFGKIIAERSLDDYFASEIILIWGCNPLYTQIPNAHTFTEARYHGTRLVAISPDLNASGIHVDQWVPIKPGTDAALALSMCQVILEEHLQDEAFVREQTDLGFLVRSDTHRFLREADLESGGSDEVLYLFDTATNAPVAASQTTLDLGGLVPALSGTHEVQTLTGKVSVRPVLAVLEEKLRAGYTPDEAAAITGVSADTIRNLARDIAKAKTVANVTSSNWSKFYHGNLVERSQILLLSLCGHMGKKGSGFSAFPFLTNDGLDQFSFLQSSGTVGELALKARILAVAAPLKLKGFTDEMITYELGRQLYKEGRWVSGVLFWNVHGGLLDLAADARHWDPHLKREVKDYLDESLDKGWQYVYPPPGQPPRVIFEVGSNILRRLRGYPQLFKKLFPELRAFVTLDSRMSSSALQSDYVLPVTAWYERTEHKWATPLMPFIHAGTKVASFQETKSDWEITALLAKKIQDKAKAGGPTRYKTRSGEEKSFETAYDDFSMGGEFTEGDEDKVAGEVVRLSTNLEGVEWDSLKKKGYARFTSVGGAASSVGNACDIEPGETVSPFTWHTQKKMIYPTLTRRIQFYIDHELYLELGEELPVHKDSPSSGGNHPLVMTGGHTRWSIHASWRDDALMQRQQRGEPVMYINTDDAAARGIADGDEVEVRNDLDKFHIHAKVAPGVRPGQVIVYHAWENHQFRDGKGFQNLIASPINPVELAGGQFHLRPMFICLQPGQSDRDTRVEVAKAV